MCYKMTLASAFFTVLISRKHFNSIPAQCLHCISQFKTVDDFILKCF